MNFEHITLDNGLNIVAEKNNSAQSAAVGFFVRTGSRDENHSINGVSHFLEHMIFKGTDNISALEVNEAFDKTGAQFNAFTSEENTVYYASILPEHLNEVTALWTQLMRPALRNDDFNMEKNVIKEEIAMYQDLPNFDVMDRCRSLHFDTHPCGNSVLGTADSIDRLTAEQMRNYFQSRYAPNNMTVAITGNFDFDKILSLIQTNCSQWQSYDVDRKLEHYLGTKKKERIVKPSIIREHICLMSPAVSFQDERKYAASILAHIIGDSTGSRFFWELVDKALAESAEMQCETMDGTGAFYSYVRCDSKNSEIVLSIIDSIFSDIDNKGVTEEELQKAKNKILSALVLKDEIPMGRLIEVGFNWVYSKKYQQIEETVNAVKSVSIDDIYEIIKSCQLGKYTQFSLGPAQSN